MALKVKNLSVSFQDFKNHEASSKKIIDDVSFDLTKSKITALIGESGSGKSSISLAILKILRKAEIKGEIIFNNQNILNLSEEKLQKIRGQNISIIFQDPNSALNPLHKINKQIQEAIKIHNPKISSKKLKKRVEELLEMVDLKDFSSRINDFAHQFSGGQKQRIMIAIALANNPQILLMDEPTTALDSETQNEILKLIAKLKKELNLAILFITHNLTIVQKIADEILVLNEGKIVEKGDVKQIFQNPQNDYVKKLVEIAKKNEELAKKPLKTAIFNEELNKNTILIAKNFQAFYKVKDGFFSSKNLFVNEKIDFKIDFKKNLGIVGKSGSGKSTFAKALINLVDFDGKLQFFTQNFSQKNIQIVFQDPFSSLNPRFLIKDIIAEGLIIHNFFSENKKTQKLKIYQKVDEILQKVRLDIDIKNRYPHQISGGQRQRVAIARSLILNPKILILDEPTSALDFIVQNEILELLKNLQKNHDISYILISHDLNVINYLCDEVITFGL